MTKTKLFLIMLVIAIIIGYVGIYYFSISLYSNDIQAINEGRQTLPAFLTLPVYLSVFVLPIIAGCVAFVWLDNLSLFKTKTIVSGCVVFVLVLELVSVLVFVCELNHRSRITLENTAIESAEESYVVNVTSSLPVEVY